MLRNILKFGTLISLCLIVIGIGLWLYTIQTTKWAIVGSLPESNQQSLLELQQVSSSYVPDTSSRQVATRLSDTPFDPAQFASPPIAYRPWTRWWLPGNRLDELELLREIHSYWKVGFGGLELYPLSAGLEPKQFGQPSRSVFEYYSPAFQHKLAFILEEAAKRKLEIDLLLGTGTPTGGSHISLVDNIQTLAYGESYILGDKHISIDLPLPKLPGAYYLSELARTHQRHPAADNWLHFYPEYRELVALYATKYREGNRTESSLNLTDSLRLDPDSTFLITEMVDKDGMLNWDAPKGYWKLVAIYAMPTGERPIYSTDARPGFVLNPFDSTKVLRHHDWILNSESGISPYFGRGLRAIFHDHFVFHAERHYARGILQDFAMDHGYSLLPYLPILLRPGHDNFLMKHAEWKRKPDFYQTEWDSRIQHDYSVSVSNRFIRDYLGSSNKWARSHQLLSRVQPYGIDIDIIKAAPHIGILEAEQRYAGGSEMFLKLVSSGSIWAKKQLISAETAGHQQLAGNMFPLRLKVAANKLFTAGFNHLVLHGTSYQLSDQKSTSKINPVSMWTPFSSPQTGVPNFSGNFSESSPFWPYQTQLNQYISRCQYMLRQGRPQVEVLIYYPFLGFPSSFANQSQHQEWYFNGSLKDYFSPILEANDAFPLSLIDQESDPRNLWLTEMQAIIEVLNEAGLSWAWVNDELLAELDYESYGMRLKDQVPQMVMIPNAPYMRIAAAENIVRLSRQGANILIYGTTPTGQPGFANRERNDQMIRDYFEELRAHRWMDTPKDLRDFLVGYPIHQEISFASHLPYLRKVQRVLDNGDIATFVHNTLDQDRFAALRTSADFSFYYWFNPQTGLIFPAEVETGQVLKTKLGPYQGMFLLASRENSIADSLLESMPMVERDFWALPNSLKHELKRWDIIVSASNDQQSILNLQDTSLQDWRKMDALKYTDSDVLYLHHLMIGDTLPNKHYILDLGKLSIAADIQINTAPIGSLSHPPYRIDVSGHLIPGDNIIEIWVKPPQINQWIGMGHNNQDGYQPYKNHDALLNPAGIIGPVLLWEVEKEVQLSEIMAGF